MPSWPRQPTRDLREIITETLGQSSEFLRAPRTVLVWEEPGEGHVNVAWEENRELRWSREPEATYGSFVLPANGYADFGRAIRQKFVLEVSSLFERER